MEPVKRLKRELRAKGTVINLYKDTVEVNGNVLHVPDIRLTMNRGQKVQ